MSSIFSRRICSASFGAVSSPSAPHRLPRRDLLGVDLLESRALLEARTLTLGRVRGRHRQELRGSQLVGDRQNPLDQRSEEHTSEIQSLAYLLSPPLARN